MVRRLRTRAILLVALVALLPLATLGALAIQRARSTLLEEASLSNADLAKRAATEIETHVEKYVDTLKHLSETLSPATGLSPQQAESVLHNYRRSVHDLRDLDYVGADGREIATGRVDGRTRDRSSDKAVRAALANELYRSPVFISEDLLPQMTIAVPQRSAGRVVGALVANVDLTEMWRVIDRIHVGARGYARVVGEDGTLLAVGDGKLKRLVFTREKDTSGPIVNQVLHGEKVPGTRYRGADGVEVLAVGQPIRSLGWALILEQPIDEALAPYYRFTSLILAISIVLLGLAALAGFLGAASVVRPIEVLRLRAGEIAQGLLEKRVEVRSPEELHALAEAMNQMCSDLIRLQDDVRKKERIATLGRLAAGLAHDLKHPVRACGSGPSPVRLSAVGDHVSPSGALAPRRRSEAFHRGIPRSAEGDLHLATAARAAPRRSPRARPLERRRHVRAALQLRSRSFASLPYRHPRRHLHPAPRRSGRPPALRRTRPTRRRGCRRAP